MNLCSRTRCLWKNNSSPHGTRNANGKFPAHAKNATIIMIIIIIIPRAGGKIVVIVPAHSQNDKSNNFCRCAESISNFLCTCRTRIIIHECAQNDWLRIPHPCLARKIVIVMYRGWDVITTMSFFCNPVQWMYVGAGPKGGGGGSKKMGSLKSKGSGWLPGLI
jgi:hypothetical protein